MQTDLQSPKITVSTHIKPLRGSIYTNRLNTNTSLKKKKKRKRNRAAKQQCLSKTGLPVQCALSAHAKDKVGHARCEKSKSKITQWKCCSICVISEIFLWRSVLALMHILFPCLFLFKCVTCIAPLYVFFTCIIFSVNSLKR